MFVNDLYVIINVSIYIYVYVYEYNHTNQKVMIQCFYSKLEPGNEKSEMIETKDDTFYMRSIANLKNMYSDVETLDFTFETKLNLRIPGGWVPREL